MSKNTYIRDSVIFEKTTIQVLFEKVFTWLKKEKKVRIIESTQFTHIKFFFEKDLEFFGFGRPFTINFSQDSDNVVLEILVPFPKSHEGLTDTPLVAYLALEEIYQKIGVQFTDALYRKVFPERVINNIVTNKIANLYLWIILLIILIIISLSIIIVPSNNPNDRIFMLPIVVFYPFVFLYVYTSSKIYYKYKKIKDLYRT